MVGGNNGLLVPGDSETGSRQNPADSCKKPWVGKEAVKSDPLIQRGFWWIHRDYWFCT